MFNRKENLNNACPKCGKGPSWGILKMIDSGGRERFPYFCQFCLSRSQLFVKKKEVPPNILEGPPSVILKKF